MKNKIDSITVFLSFSLSWILTIIVGYTLSFIKNELNANYITQTYNVGLENFISEKSENMQYIVLTIFFPCVFIILYKIISKIKLEIKINNINSYLILIGSIIIVSVFYIINKIEPFCLSETILFKAPLEFLVCSIATICFIFLYEFSNKNIKKYINIVTVCISSIAIVLIVWLHITKNYDYIQFSVHHFDAYFYPVYKVFSGQTILIDFNCLYGFYPYLLLPIFKIIGNLNMYNFSVIMAILVGTIYLSISICIYKICKNKVIALLGNLSIMFFTCLFPIIYHQGGFYLQYLPHRMLFPTIFILICTLYIYSKDKKEKKIEIICYILCCFSVLWNIDTGIIIVITWCVFLIFNQMLKYDFNKKELYVQSFKYIIFSLTTVIMAYIILLIITFARTGNILRIENIISGQKVFYGSGFYMLKMPLIHQWIILVLIYSIGLAKSLKNISFIKEIESEYDKSRIMIYFVLSVLGMGLFSYYQGRSHNEVFVLVTWPGLMLFTLYVDEGICKLKKYYKNNTDINIEKKINLVTYLSKSLFGIAILVCLSGSYIYNFKDSDSIKILKEKDTFLVENNIARESVDFIKKVRTDNEPVDLIMLNSSTIYSILGEKDKVSIPATIDWFTKDDYKKVINWIRNTDNKIIFDMYSYDLLKKYNNKEINEILNNKFTLEKQTDTFIVFTHNKN